jgi:hypothetical protein
MTVRKLSPGKIIILLLAFVFLLGIGTIAVLGRRMVPPPYVCHSQTVQDFPMMAGARFTVTHTQCEDYTHKQFVSVYVQRFVAPGSPFFKYWFNKPVLLFRYHPENANGPMPTLAQTAAKVVEISVPRVAQIDDRRRQWLGLTIRYRIGKVDHPLVAGRD